jgi:molecular chaperone HscB
MQKKLNKELSPFHIFGIEPTFNIDTKKIHSIYIEKQRKLHPDNFTENSQKEAASNLSSKLNNAYKTINNPLLRAKTYLEHTLDEIIDDSSIKTPSELLLEAMDWQEMIEESSSKDEIDEVQKYARNLFDKECNVFRNADKDELINSYIKMKYINRFIENLESKII